MRFCEHELNDEKNNTQQLRLFHSTVPAGNRAYHEHHHTEFEFSMPISGHGVYFVNGQEYEFKAGDIFLFGSNELHCVTYIDENEKFELLNVQFEPRFLWSNTGLCNINLLKIFFDRNDNFKNRLDGEKSQTKKIAEMIFQMEREFEDKQFGYEPVIQMNLLFILINIIRNFDYTNNHDTWSSYAQVLPELEIALNYINDNLESELTLEEIASKATMSRTYFSTVFKKFNGITPWEYITIKRVERSIKMLKTSNETKLSIALKCGFGSSSNFYKSFQRVTGKTPGEYMKKYL